MCRFDAPIEVDDHDGPVGVLVCLTPSGQALPPTMIVDGLEDAAARCLVVSLEEARKTDVQPPDRIRVDDPTIARELEAQLVETDVEVVVAPTPEADALRKSFDTFLAEHGPGHPEVELATSFFDERRGVTPEIVRRTGQLALQFRALRPWTFAAGQSIIRVDIPAFRVHDAHLAILFDEGMGGWMIRHLDEEMELDEIPEYLAVGFVHRDDLSDELREEARQHDLPADEEGAIALLFAGDGDDPRRPLEADDHALATALLEVLVHFLPTHRDLFEKGVPRQVETTYTVETDDGPVSIAVAAVHESFLEEQDLHGHGESDDENPY